MQTEIEIDSKKERLDIEFIHGFITNSYWGKGRTMSTMKTCIDNSLNFGVYLKNRQIGYGRLVTDYGQFAYIMDIFIAPDYRGHGYSKQLIKHIIDLKELGHVKLWRLATRDAHGLYKQFGFKPIENPEKLMEFLK